MRILLVTATYLPTINGVSYQISVLKKALEKLGHKVFVLTPSFPGYTETDKTIFRYPSIPSLISKTYPVGLPLISQKNLKKIRPDIIHVHHPSIVGQFAGILSKRLEIPLFFTAHTQYEKYIHQYFPHGKKITSKILISDLKNLSEKCFKVITPSTNMQQKFRKMGIKNTFLIHNSIEVNFFHKPPKADYEVPTLVYTGRVDKEKNLLFLIAVAKELKKLLPNFHLLILGDGSMFEDFANRVYREKLQENIILAGEVARTILPDIYKTCHIFITPSLTEVLPLSVIEAMAGGLPVLALKNSNLEDIVINEKTGYLLPKNPSIVAQKILYLFENPNLLSELSNSSYNHSLQFSIETKSKELENLYKEAISGKLGKRKFRGHRGKTF